MRAPGKSSSAAITVAGTILLLKSDFERLHSRVVTLASEGDDLKGAYVCMCACVCLSLSHSLTHIHTLFCLETGCGANIHGNVQDDVVNIAL